MSVNFQIESLVSDVLDMARESAEQKGIAVDFQANGGIEVKADPEMLRLVLSNVLDNSIKFSPKNDGKVTVQIMKDQGAARWSVVANGIGMSDSEMKQIFALEKTISVGSDGEKGAGIGLVLSKELIEMNGGELLAFRNANQGMRMCVKLPMSKSYE